DLQAPGSVTNATTITATGIGGYGVSLSSGSLSNGVNALIEGGKTAVVVRDGAGTIDNSGTLLGDSYRGVRLIAAGTVTNNAGGLIKGQQQGIYGDKGVIVVNADGGLISGGDGGVYVKDGIGSLDNSGIMHGTGRH